MGGREETVSMLDDRENKKFNFIDEQIKKKPFYKKKWFIQGLAGIGLAIVFGSVAGISFAVVKSWADTQFGQPKEPEQIVIVQDDTETESQKQTETQTETQPETQSESQTEEMETEEIETEEENKLDISDYMSLYEQMYEVASDTADSIVTVTGVSSNVDWFNKVIENNVQVSGLIIADNRTHLFILTENRAIEGAQSIKVTFHDGCIADATLQKVDIVTKLAVIKLPLSSLDEETLDNFTIAELGNSKTIGQGAPVISIGNSLGYSSNVAFGMVTSVTAKSLVDSEYNIITTDIIGNMLGSGILTNLDGEIVGIIAQDYGENDGSTVSALAISDLKYLIGMLSNSKEITYLGIVGTVITDTIASKLDMPTGISVRSVELESPAMRANIMVDDVLVAMDGQEILTIKDYVKVLRSHKAEDLIVVKVKRRGVDGRYVDMEINVALDKY